MSNAKKYSWSIRIIVQKELNNNINFIIEKLCYSIYMRISITSINVMLQRHFLHIGESDSSNRFGNYPFNNFPFSFIFDKR